MPDAYEDVLAEVTQGKPYVFVIMGYHAEWPVYEIVEQLVQEQFGVLCIRADHVRLSGYNLLHKIHWLIRHAVAVIAEISVDSPNVFYEVGYTSAVREPPLFLVNGAAREKMPTDLEGLETISYRLDREGTSRLRRELVEHLSSRVTAGTVQLRPMLLGAKSDNNYILASPRYPEPGKCIWGWEYDTRTFGDYQAILRLVSAFSPILGAGRNVELISARHIPPDTLARSWNLYLVGSGNVNPLCDALLMVLQDGAENIWSFKPMPGYTYDDPRWPSGLFVWAREGEKYWGAKPWTDPGVCASGSAVPAKPGVWREDYGLIVRGPHPRRADDGRIVMLLAGSHALGTGATGIAATEPDLIERIRDLLPPGTLEDKESKFWVLVKGVANAECRLDVKDVSIVHAGLVGDPLPDPPVR